jgi:DNA-binding MarR family transcriptional regulator
MLLYLVKQVELAARARLDDIFRPIGLTALQYTALTVLERHDDMSSAQLARHSFVTAQSMADMVAALEARGLIQRSRDDADRRRLVVALTGEGRALLDRYRDTVRALEECMLAGLSDAEVTAFRATLDTCHANLARLPAAAPSPSPASPITSTSSDPATCLSPAATPVASTTPATSLSPAATPGAAIDPGLVVNPGKAPDPGKTAGPDRAGGA